MNENTFWRSLGIGVGVIISVSLILGFLGSRDDDQDVSSRENLISLAPSSDPYPVVVSFQPSQLPQDANLDEDLVMRKLGESNFVDDLNRFDSELPDDPARVGIALRSDHHLREDREESQFMEPEKISNDQTHKSGLALQEAYGRQSAPIQRSGMPKLEIAQDSDSLFLNVQQNPFFQQPNQSGLAAQLTGKRGTETTIPNDPETRHSSDNRQEKSWHDLELGLEAKLNIERTMAKKDNSNLDIDKISRDATVAATPRNFPLNEAVAIQAAQRIEYGKTLARRGAIATSKQEFQAALSVLAQGFDSQSQSSQYSQSLSRGLMALQEADDFLTQDTSVQFGYKVAELIEAHQSKVVDPVTVDQLSLTQALQAYLAYSQQQLETGAGNNVVASEAFYCLGKLHTTSQNGKAVKSKSDTAKAIVFHRASTSSDPQNYRSANELGVLLANLGELNESKEWLKHSLRTRSTAKAWENLAKVHQRLNEPQLAQLAMGEYQQALLQVTGGAIHWLDTPQFEAGSPQQPFSEQAVGIVAGNQEVKSPKEKNNSSSGNFGWGNRLKSVY